MTSGLDASVSILGVVFVLHEAVHHRCVKVDFIVFPSSCVVIGASTFPGPLCVANACLTSDPPRPSL